MKTSSSSGILLSLATHLGGRVELRHNCVSVTPNSVGYTPSPIFLPEKAMNRKEKPWKSDLRTSEIMAMFATASFGLGFKQVKTLAWNCQDYARQ